MWPDRVKRSALGLLVLALAANRPAVAEDFARKWRIGLDLGAFSPQSEIESDAANTLTLYTAAGEPQSLYIDPRPDAARFGTLAMQPAGVVRLSAQYAVTRTFVLEATLGYSKTTVGDVEVHYQYGSRFDISDTNFDFTTYRLALGDATFVPLTLNALYRFRPDHRFNPYVGGGIGYQWVGLDPSSEFDTASLNLDRSYGIQSFMIPRSAVNDSGIRIFVPNVAPEDLAAATADTPETFIWNVVAGAELAVSRRWALTFDLRYRWASRQASVGFNGGEDLGISVPQGQDFVGSPAASATYGPLYIEDGGMLDVGSRVPGFGLPPDFDCNLAPFFCSFQEGVLDGVPDPGFYYANGGTLDYEIFEFTLGARYVF